MKKETGDELTKKRERGDGKVKRKWEQQEKDKGEKKGRKGRK